MKPYVFLGPSLPLEQARQHLDAVYLPPVSCGDIASLVARERPRVIGIIDGYFEGIAPVWHKEILLALAQGVRVLGGASMGALRAAELCSMGMIGVGVIFGWYRDGVLDADDEVAVRHASSEFGYRPLSEALVNIRATLLEAVRLGVISRATEERLLEIARRTHYGDRAYPSMFACAKARGVDSASLRALEMFTAEHKIDQKQRDAVEALRAIAVEAELAGTVAPRFELQETTFLHDLLDRDQPVQAGADPRLTHEQLVDYARVHDARFGQLQRELVDENISLRYARSIGVEVDRSELQAELDAFRRASRLHTKADTLAWLSRNRLDVEELGALIERRLLVDKVRRLCSKVDNRAVLGRFRLDGGYPALEQAALAAEREAAPRFEEPAYAEERLLEFYCNHRGRAVPRDLDALALELGFTDRVSLIVELERYYRRHARSA